VLFVPACAHNDKMDAVLLLSFSCPVGFALVNIHVNIFTGIEKILLMRNFSIFYEDNYYCYLRKQSYVDMLLLGFAFFPRIDFRFFSEILVS
jgi:hypothetical protein